VTYFIYNLVFSIWILNELITTKKTSAIFLAIVLVAGTIPLSFPSFMTTANALSGPLFTEDNSYNSYEPREHQPEHADKKYNSYESTKYEADIYEKPSYRNDNYEQPEYSTYTPDYKPQYSSSYGQDRNNYYESKDSSSVSLKKINCNNINLNLNGLDINTTATGAEVTDGSAVEAASLMGNGNGNNGYGERNNNYVQRGEDFTFVCINNNNNTVIADDDDVIDACPEAEEIESCFEDFTSDETFLAIETALESPTGLTVEINGLDVTLRSFSDICEALEGLTFEQLQEAIRNILFEALDGPTVINLELFSCIAEALGIPVSHG
jgi:hypothetical protein